MTSHRMSNSKEYKTWLRMKSLCDNPVMSSYPIFGGKGITYCPEWKNFINFYNDMGAMPEYCTGIELINLNADFSKHNCKWVGNKTRRNLKEMPGNKNRKVSTRIHDATAISMAISKKMLSNLKQIAFMREKETGIRCSVGQILRDLAEEKYPIETQSMFG